METSVTMNGIVKYGAGAKTSALFFIKIIVKKT